LSPTIKRESDEPSQTHWSRFRKATQAKLAPSKHSQQSSKD
jgi:hypothetical protein